MGSLCHMNLSSIPIICTSLDIHSTIPTSMISHKVVYLKTMATFQKSNDPTSNDHTAIAFSKPYLCNKVQSPSSISKSVSPRIKWVSRQHGQSFREKVYDPKEKNHFTLLLRMGEYLQMQSSVICSKSEC